MKTKMNLIVVLALILTYFGIAGVLHADDSAAGASPELIAKGKELFTTKQGLNVKFECLLCHKGDKAIKKADIEKAGDKLPAVINKYITTKAKGPALAEDSEQMKALMAYIKYEHAK